MRESPPRSNGGENNLQAVPVPTGAHESPDTRPKVNTGKFKVKYRIFHNNLYRSASLDDPSFSNSLIGAKPPTAPESPPLTPPSLGFTNVTSAKRRRTNTNGSGAPITLQNSFAVLGDLMDTNQREQEIPSEQPNIRSHVSRPPPIYLFDITDMNQVLTNLKALGLSKLNYTVGRDGKVKFSSETIDDYRKMINYLSNNNAQYYTYQANQERSFRVVLRGLHHTSDKVALAQELKDLGFEPTQIVPVLHPVTKVPLPLFFLDLKPNPTNPEIFKLTHLYGASIHVEPPKPKKTIIQCLRCQAYGHSKNYCNKAPRCARCNNYHPTPECNLPPGSPSTCVNCGGSHTANYKGCPTHKALQKAKFTPTFKRANAPRLEHSLGTSSNQNNIPRSAISQGRSYATAVIGEQLPKSTTPSRLMPPDDVPQQPPPLSPASPQHDIFPMLISKIDSLLATIQPMVQMLAQIIPKLLSLHG